MQRMAGSTRLAAMGGAYGNVSALAACVRDARGLGAGHLAFLGDAIGCCGHSEEVLAAVRADFDLLVAGNHEQQAAQGSRSCGCGYASPEDEAVSCEAFQVATAELTEQSKAWLGTWPERAVVELPGGKVLLCHGSPGQTSEFLYEVELDDLRLEAWLDQFGVRGFVCTHSGLPFVRRLRGGRFAVNCGAVGKPDHDADTAVHYASIELASPSAAPQIEIRRVAYDHEAWAKRMEAAKIAPMFVEPVRTGVWTNGVSSLPLAERHRYLRNQRATGGDWAPEILQRDAVRRALTALFELGLVRGKELEEILGLFEPAFPFFGQLRLADSLHVHLRVDDVKALPRAALLSLGAGVDHERDGYVKYLFPGGVNLICSSIDVAEEDLLGPLGTPRIRPFVDHVGIDLRRETGRVLASFEDTPALARRAGWFHKSQGGLGRAVHCCHSQVSQKHWVYPPTGARWQLPVELAYGRLVTSQESGGCDLRPIDPKHPAAASFLACVTA